MNQQAIKQFSGQLLEKSRKTNHSRLVACGILVGVIFSPFWIYKILVSTLGGGAAIVMTLAGVLGAYLLWQDRNQLSRLQVSEEDRWLGHLIIASGLVLSPLCALAEWSQRLIWAYILIGIALSSWGFKFFKYYSIPIFLIAMGLFPQPSTVAKALWQTFVPPELLERSMAWIGAMGLRVLGHPAVLERTIISLPGGAVRVDESCTGFTLAIIMGASSVLLGLFLKQRLKTVIVLFAIGFFLTLVGNIPRIILLAMAEAYWGKESFDFWHGPWGGQIFTIILMTIYYYAFMAIIKRKRLVPMKN